MYREMASRPDRSITEGLLAGDPAAADALPAVAGLLRSAADLGAREPSASMVTTMATATTASPGSASSLTPTLGRVLTAKVAAVVAVMAFTATGAAAATGSLPDAAQDGIARAASHVGLDLPDSADDHARDASTGHVTPPAAEPTTNHTPPETTHGAEVSDTARDRSTTGPDTGASVSTVAKGHHGPADHGPADHTTGAPPSDRPPATTPDHGAAAGPTSPVRHRRRRPLPQRRCGRIRSTSPSAPPQPSPPHAAGAHGDGGDGGTTAAETGAAHPSP